MILHLILRYLGTDPCRRWLRPVRDLNPNDCYRLTELSTSMLVLLQTVQWTVLDDSELNPTEYGWENVAFEPSPIMRDFAPATDCILQYKRCNTGLRLSLTLLGYCSASLKLFLRFLRAINTSANDIAPYYHTLFTGTYIKYFLKFKALRKICRVPWTGIFFWKSSWYIVSEINNIEWMNEWMNECMNEWMN